MMITDAERNRAVLTLREQYASGALTFDEFDEQLHDVLAARSRDQLRDLIPSGELLLDTPPLAAVADLVERLRDQAVTAIAT